LEVPDGEGKNAASTGVVDRESQKPPGFTIRHIYAVNMSCAGDKDGRDGGGLSSGGDEDP
jgi:hypothetical protein